MKNLDALNKKAEILSSNKIVDLAVDEFGKKLAFATSLSIEDQVILDMLTKTSREPYIFSLDTGRLHEETYKVILNSIERYGVNMNMKFPDREKVEALLNKKGPFSFYDSVENRRECCAIRKVEPLQRTLKNFDAWIVGLRAEQSVTRESLKPFEWDTQNGLVKISPLLNWSEEEVLEYLNENNVPYNTLYKQGFRSIGCAPCTRAVRENEPARNGRWWWENPETKECGLHKH